jgi:hypothetical protein
VGVARTRASSAAQNDNLALRDIATDLPNGHQLGPVEDASLDDITPATVTWRAPFEGVPMGTPGSILSVPILRPQGSVWYNFDSHRTTFPGGVRAEFPRTFPPVGSRLAGLSP